jgi:hypothetical protein
MNEPGEPNMGNPSVRFDEGRSGIADTDNSGQFKSASFHFAYSTIFLYAPLPKCVIFTHTLVAISRQPLHNVVFPFTLSPGFGSLGLSHVSKEFNGFRV